MFDQIIKYYLYLLGSEEEIQVQQQIAIPAVIVDNPGIEDVIDVNDLNVIQDPEINIEPKITIIEGNIYNIDYKIISFIYYY